jgi:NAD-dependent dihydropyrimidine dehydrogenase PreA subunit
VTFVITQPCIDTMDQSCVEVCPVDCIHFEEGADRMLYINPAECIDCGACQPACPVSAIFPEADVPGDQARFTPINSLWYDDPASARAQVEGGAAAAPATPRPEAAAVAAPTPAAAREANVESQATADAAAAAPAAPAAAHAPAATGQVAAEEEEHHGPVQVPHYGAPSPMGVLTLIGVMLAFSLMWVFPGPTVLDLPGFSIDPEMGPLLAWDGDVPLGFIVGIPLTLFFLGGFLDSQRRDLGKFDSKREREIEQWRGSWTVWRRSEESRRYDQERAVEALAQTRFAFPTMQHPDYRTHVNVPEATLALEFGGGGGVKVFPDILVVQYPGNYPVMVAQVETRETVSRDQAERVWKQLESDEAPLYIYVPTGLGARADDNTPPAGHKQIRTWRRQPEGVIVQEIGAV